MECNKKASKKRAPQKGEQCKGQITKTGTHTRFWIKDCVKYRLTTLVHGLGRRRGTSFRLDARHDRAMIYGGKEEVEGESSRRIETEAEMMGGPIVGVELMLRFVFWGTKCLGWRKIMECVLGRTGQVAQIKIAIDDMFGCRIKCDVMRLWSGTGGTRTVSASTLRVFPRVPFCPVKKLFSNLLVFLLLTVCTRTLRRRTSFEKLSSYSRVQAFGGAVCDVTH